MPVKLSDYRTYDYVKATPQVVTEAMGAVELCTITKDLPAGVYEVTVSLVAGFTTANDQLTWRGTGALASPDFLLEAKDDLEVIPVAYTFPEPWAGGVLTFGLEVEITGAGAADVNIDAGNIVIKRVL